MFDNIQFHKFNTAHINADNYLPEYWYSLEDYHKTNDTTMYTAALEADFSISGSVYVLPLRPVSDYAKEHYLYFQEFGLFQSDDSYYTRRSNYKFLFNFIHLFRTRIFGIRRKAICFKKR